MTKSPHSSPKRKKQRVEPSPSPLERLTLPLWHAKNQLRGNTTPATDVFSPMVFKTLTREDGNDQSYEEHADRMGDENTPRQGNPRTKGIFHPPPTSDEARQAMEDIKLILNPPRKKGPGHIDPKLDLLFRGRLEGMRQFLWAYVNPNSATHSKWMASSTHTADALERKPDHAKQLREWPRMFITNREDLLVNKYGVWNESVLDKDESLAQDIQIHLQGVGKFVKAKDLVDYIDTPELQMRTGHASTRLSIATAQRWMKTTGYWWTRDPKGQFVDGHERADVIAY
jgi:hypothetical protein